LVVDRVAILEGTTTITPGAGQTVFSAATNSGTTANDVRGASSWEAGAASITMSEALSGGGQRWEIGGVPVKPAIADLVTTATPLSPDPVALNGTTSTTFTITNNGPQAATGATFTITLPGSVTSPVATPSSGSCSGTGPISCTFPTIANGASVTVALSVTAPTAGTISITGTDDDTVEYDPPANSSATVTAKAQSPCATPGDDGAGGTLTGVVNSYFPGTSTGTGTITVGAGAGANLNISSGDLLLVIQMQDADINSTNTANYGANTGTGVGYTNLNSAGRYEFVVATSGITFGTGGTININQWRRTRWHSHQHLHQRRGHRNKRREPFPGSSCSAILVRNIELRPYRSRLEWSHGRNPRH
jgi:hypothetical protein